MPDGTESGCECPLFLALMPLRRDKAVGPAVWAFYLWLWHLAGGHPNEISFRMKRAADVFGVHSRAIDKWVVNLQERGLSEVIEHDKRRGMVRVYVFHPLPELRGRRPDPQRLLALGTGATEVGNEEGRPLCAHEGQTETGGRPLCAHEGQIKTLPAGKGITLEHDIVPRVEFEFDDEEESHIIIKLKRDNPIWKLLPGAADELVCKLYRKRGDCPVLDRRETVFLATVAFLKLNFGEGWVTDAIDATAAAEIRKSLGGLLRVSLRRAYAANFGVAPEVFEELVARLRGPIRRFLDRTKWAAHEGFARRRPETEPERRARELKKQQEDAGRWRTEHAVGVVREGIE